MKKICCHKNYNHSLKIRRCKKCEHSLKKKHRKCQNCGYTNNSMRQNKKNRKIENWQELHPGNKIRTKPTNGGGPYRIVNEKKYTFAHSGEFIVHKIVKDGIHAHGKHGHVFLWMGKSHLNKNNTYMETYNIEFA